MEALTEIPEHLRELIEGASTDAGVELDSPPESALVTAGAVAAAVAARHGLKHLWKRWRGTEPPDNPSLTGVRWSEALLWAAGVGAAVGVARVVGRRSASAAAHRLAARRR